MITNFFLDNRVGGPHIYSRLLYKNLSYKKFINVTNGKTPYKSLKISNLREISKYFFPLEIIINFLEIYFLFKNKNKNKIFFVYTIYNIAPIICGKFLNKKVYWFILEKPTIFSKIIFLIINSVFQLKLVFISRKIAEELNIKKYIYLPPKIDTNFWSKKEHAKIKKKIVITNVGNLNQNKNQLYLIENLEKSKIKYIFNIIGEKLKTQKNYYNNLKNYVNFINSKKINKINLLGKKNHFQIKKILKNTNVFILGSKTEGLPISLLEAMSMQCFPIISKESNISKIVVNNHNGLVFDLKERSFVNCILKYFKMTDKNKKIIARNSKRTVINLNKVNEKINF
tara:strand:+ start:3 stop:1025 length:1023 start_codon:yes stop_codon:yes gene_type:complete